MKTNKEKLNIAMICDPVGDEAKAGAVVSALRFGKILQDRGHKVIFVGAKSSEHKGHHSEHRGMKTYRFRSLPLPKSGGWHLGFPTVGEMRKIFIEEKIDVVHIVLPMSCGLVAIKAAQQLGIKIVAHSHSQPENLFMNAPKFLRPILDASWNKYLAWVYSKGEVIIYPSALAKRLLSHLTQADKESVVISNGVNSKQYTQLDIGDFNKRYGIPSGVVKLLYVGRIFPEKSIDTLILAIPHIIKIHESVHVIIAGKGYLLPRLKELVGELGVNKYVTFISPISDEDKILAYNACDIFVSPSFAELEGMTTLEAMAIGKPIVVPNAEMNASRYFVDGNGYLFETANPESLAREVLKLVVDEKLRKEMAEESLRMSRGYDIFESTERLEDVYRNVTSKK